LTGSGHKVLRSISWEVLNGLGYTPHWGKILYTTRPWWDPLLRRKVVVDVFGDGNQGAKFQKVAIECSKCNKQKLISLSSVVDLVILWGSPWVTPSLFIDGKSLTEEHRDFLWEFTIKAKGLVPQEVLDEYSK